MSRQSTSSRITADSKKVNSELFVLTYGTLVQQLVKDYESVEDVNKQLERIGYNIGLRVIEDFLARTNYPRCTDLRDTAEKIQAAFKMYLNATPSLSNVTADEFSLVFESTPFGEFTELPDACANLKYCNVLPGVIRGACEMVQMDVQAYVIADTLKGDNATEIRVRFIKKLHDALPAGED
ncbi:unnamed protein product [Orchesella dallaii]|uniref:Trafficking protein particle complex subunit n=1 Tax=Orchesella dallaii TaxID=48710 RepID=A0ABP1QPN2_9HEXA